jgi:hypothetical protein
MSSELKWARSIKRGIAVLFIAGGLLRLWRWTGSGEGLEGPFTSILLAAVGLGLFLRFRWARKAAMGACFLAIVGACVYPFWVLESRPFAEAGEEIQTNILMGVFAATFAWLGYRGLKYFRSELAHSEFSDDATGRAKLAGEGSTSTVVSALGWVLLALFVVAANAPPSHPKKKKVVPKTEKAFERVDLVLTGLCLHGEALVVAVIENRGPRTSPQTYRITYTQLGRGQAGGWSMGRVPAPRTPGFVRLDRGVNPVEEGESQATVEVRVDADDRIRETDENNNDGRFLIRFQYFHAVSLPQCLTLSPNGINWMDAPSTSSQAATISTENTGR